MGKFRALKRVAPYVTERTPFIIHTRILLFTAKEKRGFP
jgi:hypothetical protein